MSQRVDPSLTLCAEARVLGCRWWKSILIGAFAWFGGLLSAWILVASAWVTLRAGGVKWRGTLYPIELLTENQVRI